eukprot:gene2976-14887_t
MRKARATEKAVWHEDEKKGWDWDILFAVLLSILVLGLMAYKHTSANRTDGREWRTQINLKRAASQFNSRHGDILPDGFLPPQPPRVSLGGPSTKQTFTLINSFWANTPESMCVGISGGGQENDQPCQVRHDEMLGAMRANMLNPSLAELFVIYEGRPGDGCKELEEALLKKMPAGGGRRRAAFSCADRKGGQPTYEDLFLFASTQPDGRFLGNIAIVSNVDVVFDRTLSQMPPVGRKYAYALSVNTKVNRTQYLEGMGQEPCQSVTESHGWFKGSKVRDERCPWKGMTSKKGPQAHSFDAFAFNPPLPEGWVEKSRKLSPMDDTANKLGMENRAKCGLEAAGLVVLNACLWVRMFHYHKCAWYSHPKNVFVPEPDHSCDRATYPCMLYSNEPENPLGEWEGEPVVDRSTCRKPNAKKRYTANVESLKPQKGDWKGPPTADE